MMQLLLQKQVRARTPCLRCTTFQNFLEFQWNRGNTSRPRDSRRIRLSKAQGSTLPVWHCSDCRHQYHKNGLEQSILALSPQSLDLSRCFPRCESLLDIHPCSGRHQPQQRHKQDILEHEHSFQELRSLGYNRGYTELAPTPVWVLSWVLVH